MKIGFIGLGRMGKNMVLRLLEKKNNVVVWNRSPEPAVEVQQAGAMVAKDFAELVAKLEKPRTVWIQLPSGSITHETIVQFSKLLEKGDLLIDGANSRYTDSQHHHHLLSEKGIDFLDVGVSGGILGKKTGYCLMIGGDHDAYKRVESVFADLAPQAGYRFLGPAGSGHFVKMIHNGIEYAMMQGMAEGFNLLKNGPYATLDLAAIAELWQHGSIVQSLLLDESVKGLQKDPILSTYGGTVEDSGEGQWAIETALQYKIPAETITAALYSRYHSKNRGIFAHKTLSMQRKQFGGHEEKP